MRAYRPPRPRAASNLANANEVQAITADVAGRPRAPARRARGRAVPHCTGAGATTTRGAMTRRLSPSLWLRRRRRSPARSRRSKSGPRRRAAPPRAFDVLSRPGLAQTVLSVEREAYTKVPRVGRSSCRPLHLFRQPFASRQHDGPYRGRPPPIRLHARQARAARARPRHSCSHSGARCCRSAWWPSAACA